MSDKHDLSTLIPTIDIAAPSLAKLLGGPLGGALASVVVETLQAGGVGADLSMPTTPAVMAPVAAQAPFDTLRVVLSALELASQTHLDQFISTPTTTSAAIELPNADSGVQVNATDALTRVAIALGAGMAFVVGLVSPNAGGVLQQYVPIFGSAVGVIGAVLLHHRDISRSNANTAALKTR